MSERNSILVVDDETVIAGAAVRILTAEGFDVRATGSGEDALRLVNSEEPQIVLADLMLPGLSGGDLLGRISRDHPQTAIIMMTGFSTAANAAEFLKSGAVGFLPKPFTFEELVGAVRCAQSYLKLPVSARRSACAAYPYTLGIGSWAMVDADGSARLGITALLLQLIGETQRFELPAVSSEVTQGGILAQVTSQDELRHLVWSPLSGRVLERNPFFADNRAVILGESSSNTWLVRILPDRLERELSNLSASPGARGEST